MVAVNPSPQKKAESKDVSWKAPTQPRIAPAAPVAPTVNLTGFATTHTQWQQ